MNILQDVHTYLIASFVLMLYLIYKKAYKNIATTINDGISQIEENINNLKDQKAMLSKKLGELNTRLKFEADMSQKNQIEAEERAIDITKKLKIKNQKELKMLKIRQENTQKKLIENFNADIQAQITQLVINNLTKKLKKLESNTKFQSEIIKGIVG